MNKETITVSQEGTNPSSQTIVNTAMLALLLSAAPVAVTCAR